MKTGKKKRKGDEKYRTMKEAKKSKVKKETTKKGQKGPPKKSGNAERAEKRDATGK